MSIASPQAGHSESSCMVRKNGGGKVARWNSTNSLKPQGSLSKAAPDRGSYFCPGEGRLMLS